MRGLDRGCQLFRLLQHLMNKMEMHKKHILVVDVVLILGSLLIIALFVGYTQPLAIAPLNNYLTSNASVLFQFKGADRILIDDNLEFTSPDTIFVEDDALVNLEPGNYYWKVVGTFESEVRQFTIQSQIDLRIRDAGNETYEVVNSGNEPLSVEVYNHGVLSGNVVIDVDESSQMDGDKFVGSENGS